MRLKELTLACAALAFSVGASAAPVTLKLKPLNLTNGWTVTGTVTTDGTVGALLPANITNWKLTVVQTTDLVWTDKDSNDLNISGVSSNGKALFVATSPDGIVDGGTLYFGRGGGFGQIPMNAVIADFTQFSANLGYGMGGVAGWQGEIQGLNYVGLNRALNTRYRAATAVAGSPNVFRINVPTISPAPYEMTMFGTITTDGATGLLQPQDIVAWQITARTREITTYTETSTTVLAADGVTSDGTSIKVAHAGGRFVLGVGGRRPTYVTLADFTDPAFPNGFANYYTGMFGVMGDKSPLVGRAAVAYTVAK
jgi:hypothetical protein